MADHGDNGRVAVLVEVLAYALQVSSGSLTRLILSSVRRR